MFEEMVFQDSGFIYLNKSSHAPKYEYQIYLNKQAKILSNESSMQFI